MNERETELLRDYVHFTYLLKEAKNDLEMAEDPHTPNRGLRVGISEVIGGYLSDRLKEVQQEMRELQFYVVKIEDDDTGPLIHVHTSLRRVRESFPYKRMILKEDLKAKLDQISNEMFMEGPTR